VNTELRRADFCAVALRFPHCVESMAPNRAAAASASASRVPKSGCSTRKSTSRSSANAARISTSARGLCRREAQARVNFANPCQLGRPWVRPRSRRAWAWGVARSRSPWAALRPASVESRFEALHVGGLTELHSAVNERVKYAKARWVANKVEERYGHAPQSQHR
jgi:hypothetical protein